MNRRSFFRGLLGLAAAPVIAKLVTPSTTYTYRLPASEIAVINGAIAAEQRARPMLTVWMEKPKPGVWRWQSDVAI